jgi:uncharacterized membrane protein YeaQ/YmgE (transglycosylase-associated protein family)
METLLAIIGWAIFGLLIGGLARFLVPGPQPMGFLMTAVLGVVGSLAGGFLAYAIWGGEPLQASGWILSLVGAVLVLWIGLSLTGRSGRTV